MKKSVIALLLTAMLALTACGGENPDSKESSKEESKTEQQVENTGKVQKGYMFLYKGETISVDENIEDVLKAIGEPKTYFEAASCAFEGLDKMYTYDDFEIDTYPSADGKDYISMIILKNDVVTTQEGIYIGIPRANVLKTYGDACVEEGSSIVCEKDGMKLMFILTDDEVSSIQYCSTILD